MIDKRPVTDKLKPLIRRIAPKPWNSPIMEFQYGVWLGVSTLYAENRRQLGEASARPHFLNARHPSELIACKYGGSRQGRLINISALRTAMSNFDEALEIVGAVRHIHLARLDKKVSASAYIWDLYIIARACISLIAYQTRSRRSRNSDPIISNILTSQYQFISGIFMICRHMMNDGHSLMCENQPITAEELYTYADENQIFISPNGMACAGSTGKIMQFLKFCIQPDVSNQNTEFNKLEYAHNILQPVVTNIENWYVYALRTIELDCFVTLEELRQTKKSQHGVHAPQNINDVIKGYENMRAYCAGIYGDKGCDEERDFASAVTQRQNALLLLLGMPPIKAIKQKYIHDRLGL